MVSRKNKGGEFWIPKIYAHREVEHPAHGSKSKVVRRSTGLIKKSPYRNGIRIKQAHGNVRII